MALEVYKRRKSRTRKRLAEILDHGWKEKHARRLQKELLTFLDHDEVTPDNKSGERRIRPAVLIRKNSHGNSTEKGAQPRPLS
jgi:hypothetical protein